MEKICYEIMISMNKSKATVSHYKIDFAVKFKNFLSHANLITAFESLPSFEPMLGTS
mgnify:CR=1 FL=1